MKEKSLKMLKGAVLVLLLIAPMMVFSQVISIKGKVTDSKGLPVIGASILVKGTGNGISTDIDGKYILTNVSSKAKLEISYIGMRT